MKLKLSIGQRFFAPTPYRTLLGMFCLWVIGIFCLIVYLGEPGIVSKYVGLACLGIIFILQFQVDWIAYALDEFEPISDDKPNDVCIEDELYYKNLDLTSASLKQLYEAESFWMKKLRYNVIDSDGYLSARAALQMVIKALDDRFFKESIQPENGYVYDAKTGLHFYKSKRDAKTGRFIKKEKTT